MGRLATVGTTSILLLRKVRHAQIYMKLAIATNGKQKRAPAFTIDAISTRGRSAKSFSEPAFRAKAVAVKSFANIRNSGARFDTAAWKSEIRPASRKNYCRYVEPVLNANSNLY
jgi:hypothetical protein